MLSRTTLVWLNRLLWTVLVGAVLVVGLVVSLGRHYIPYVETHQQQVVDAFNKRTGLHLSVGHISGRWQQLSPHFVIDNLRLYNPQNPAEIVVQIDHVELQLGLFRSINERTLAISSLQGRGVHVQLEEVPIGHWHLPGFVAQGETNTDALFDLLLAIYRAQLTDSQIDLHFVGGATAQIAGKTLQLQRAGDFRRINLALTFSEKSAPFTLVVETHGDPRDEKQFTARGHADLHGVDLTPVLPAAKAFGVDLQHGFIDGAVWLDWRAGGAIEVRGKAALPQLDIAGFSDLALPPVTDIKAEFLLREEAGRRQLWLPQLTGTWSDIKLDFRQLAFSTSAERPDFYRVALPELQIAPLSEALLASNELPAHLRDILSTMAARGALRNVLIDLPLKADQLRLRAELAQIAVRPWGGAPGVEGGGGYIDAGLHSGAVDLVSDGFAMEFPHVYHEPLRFDRVRGRIGWRVEGEHILVNSGPIPVEGDAGSATARFALDLPVEHGPSLMTLMVGLRNSDAQYRNRFVPYTLQPTLLEWLDRSIQGGKLLLGGFIYRGSLSGEDSLNDTVQLFLDVRDGELAYQPEWPPLHNLRAGVWVDDGDVLVQAPSARVLDRIALSNINVELHHPDSGSWLTVRGDATGADDDVLKLLYESPLHKRLGSALDKWHWRGSVHSKLDLGIPIGGERVSQLHIDSELGPGTLTLTDQHIVLTDVRGPLNYSTENGLQSPALNGKWYGKPLTLKVANETNGDLNIEAAGIIGMADLKTWLQQPLFDYADGDTPFEAKLRIAGDNSEVIVHSDLQGVTLHLPPPYNKAADQVLPLEVSMSLGGQRELLADLGEWAELRLRWDDDAQVDAGVLRLSKTGRTHFSTQQMILTGRVPVLDFNEWRDVMAQDRTAAGADKPQDANALALSVRDLQFDTVTIGGQTLNALALSGHRDAQAWQLSLAAQQLAGNLRVPDSAQQPWIAKLNYVRLPAAAAEPVVPTTTPHSALEQIDPTKIIPIDISIEHLSRGGEEWGSLSMQLRPIADGMRIENVFGQLRDVTIGPRGEQPASMTWTRRDGVDRSSFNAHLVVDDAAVALQRWHYEPVLTSKRGEIDIALEWPGAPDQFKFTQAEGDARLTIDDGRFLKASSSATGALKVVGIFNFANFLKRLQLDFSDVFKDGVSFDDMKGSFAMQHGVLKTADPLEIKSPSSRFRVAGQIDFNTDQTDMELVATLPVASNLPWVAALAGGLPVAAGVFVASKIFANQVDKFASAAYDINGPWADPKVKLRSVFDDKLQQKAADANAVKAEDKP
ncbi:MAG: hypothetical protein JWM78_2661 [Verrucomicrobiaceae bacterium]|nr:hypothetical protein [Verrucomicrobiaceae bacterium]